MAEEEQRQRDFEKALESLPRQRQELLLHWFGIQELVIDVLAIPEMEWWGHIQWALENPGDFSFVEDFPDRGAADSEEVAENLRRQRMLGQDTSKTSALKEGAMAEKAEGKGLDKELFQKFVTMRRA